MVVLGLGKNMVRAAKFWLQITGLVDSPERREETLTLSTLGRALFVGDKSEAWDPFLEDIQTLWLLHWQIATHPDRLLAWDYLLFERPNSDFTKTETVHTLLRKAEAVSRKASEVTLAQHFDVFLHTYLPTFGRKGELLEDNLDCPLTELNLIKRAGERTSVDGRSERREAVYVFSHTEKPEISPALFRYCVESFWRARFPDEKTLSLRQIVMGPGSPGLAFRLPEEDVRQRVRALAEASQGSLQFQESLVHHQLVRTDEDFETDTALLAEIYAC